MYSKLTKCLSELTGRLYRDHFHLINTLIVAVDDCGCRLGTVDLGTEDSDRRIVDVYGLSGHIVIEWTTTECGNLEGNFVLI